MTVTMPRRLKELDQSDDGIDTDTLVCVYEVLPNLSASDVGLQVGQMLPDDATFEIISVKGIENKTQSKDGKPIMGSGRRMQVTARHWNHWA